MVLQQYRLHNLLCTISYISIASMYCKNTSIIPYTKSIIPDTHTTIIPFTYTTHIHNYPIPYTHTLVVHSHSPNYRSHVPTQNPSIFLLILEINILIHIFQIFFRLEPNMIVSKCIRLSIQTNFNYFWRTYSDFDEGLIFAWFQVTWNKYIYYNNFDFVFLGFGLQELCTWILLFFKLLFPWCELLMK